MILRLVEVEPAVKHSTRRRRRAERIEPSDELWPPERDRSSRPAKDGQGSRTPWRGGLRVPAGRGKARPGTGRGGVRFGAARSLARPGRRGVGAQFAAAETRIENLLADLADRGAQHADERAVLVAQIAAERANAEKAIAAFAALAERLDALCQCSPKRDPGCASKRDPSEGARGVVPRHPELDPLPHEERRSVVVVRLREGLSTSP